MPDINKDLREIPLPVVFQWLGIDLSGFKTRKGGTEWYGRCFFHEAQKNTTSLSFTAELAHCFSCQMKFKGAIDAVIQYKKVGFQEATAWLKEMKGNSPAQPAIVQPGAESSVVEPLKPFTGKYEKYAVPCEWLEKRIPDEAVRKRYGVFCYNNPARKSAYSGRVMLPVRDTQGTLYGYLGRAISDTKDSNNSEPKYLFPPNFPKSRFLFGAHELGTFGSLPLRVVYLVESPFCVMKFALYGLPAVSPFGWSVSPEQLSIVQSLTRGLIYIPDSNKYQECERTIAQLSRVLWVKAPPLPAGIDDPEYLSLEQIQALTR